MKVDFINSAYRRFYENHKAQIDVKVLDCLAAGRLTLREDVWQLERKTADYVGVKYCASVNSGTDALFLSLLALGIGKNDEVITVSNTFIATIQAIVHTGATPILIDVDEDEQMNLDHLEAVITPKTKAVIPVHYTGMMVNMTRLMTIANEHNLHVVEDFCQALGSLQGDKKAGSFGVLNAVSFNNAKLLGGFCDGGAVTTDDRELYEKICLLRNHWNIHQLSVDSNDYPQPSKMAWAWKSRLSNVNAAFLNVKFNIIDYIINRRKGIARQYNDAFKDLPIWTPSEQEGRIWQEYHLRVDNRTKFKNFLTNHGIETLVRDEMPNHKLPGLGLEDFNLPVTEQLAKEVVRLPLHEWLSAEEVNYIIEVVINFYGK